MDWSVIASVLGDRCAQPVALLGPDTEILLFNRGMEQLLGWSRQDAVGKRWPDLIASSGGDAPWLDEGLIGAREEVELTLATRSLTPLQVQMSLRRVGPPGEHGLLVTIEQATTAMVTSGKPPHDVCYDISGAGPEFGLVHRMVADGTVLVSAPGEKHCFELLHDRHSACEDCPLLAREGDWPRHLIRSHRGDNGDTDYFELVCASRLTPSLFRVQLRNLDETTLTAIHDARLRSVAEKGQLSAREHEVLRHLVMGRTSEEIARALEITPRTVKFHQANVLKKVGADSRLELLRLVF